MSTRATARVRFAGLLGACAVLAAHAFHYDFVSDDAFIAARYARNLLAGEGLVYNAGERVEGFTSPLWVMLLAGLGTLGADLVVAMRALSFVAALACVALVDRVSRRSARDGGADLLPIATLVLAAASPFACWALAGLESTGFALTVALAVACSAPPEAPRRRFLLEGAACSACVLVRPEGVLVPLAATITRWVCGGRRTLAVSLVAVLPPIATLALLTLWRLGYYGEWLPNTAHAKLALGPRQWLRGVGYAEAFVRDQGGLVAWVAPVALAWLGSTSFTVRAAATTLVALGTGIVVVGGDGLPMYRFFVPVLPLYALLVASAAQRGLAFAQELERPARVVAVGVTTGAGLALLVALARPPGALAQYTLYRDQQSIEIPRWREVGEWLARHTPPNTSIAVVPIGAIGYYSHRPIVDMLGLTDHHVARAFSATMGLGWTGHERHDGAYILARRPGILLLGNVDVRERALALDDPAFARPDNRAIRAREDDLFTPELRTHYAPRIARLPSGRTLHYFERRR